MSVLNSPISAPDFSYLQIDPRTGKKRTGIVQAMNGIDPAFKPTDPLPPPVAPTDSNMPPYNNPTLSPPTYTLPKNYGFNDLANYESTLRNKFGQTSSADILSTRDKLASSLGDYSKQFFAQQNPAILEDLNSRGLLTSPSEVANKEAQALKEINLTNQDYLSKFDEAALNARLQAQQDALDSGLDLRRGGLEQTNANTATDKEQALVQSLADKSGRNQLNTALIGAGGSLLGGALPSIIKSFADKTAAEKATEAALATGGGTAAATGAGAGGIPLASAATPVAGGIGFGGAAAIGGAGIASALLSRAAQNKVEAATGSKNAGLGAGLIANPIGAQLNFAKDAISKVFGAGKTGTNVGNQQAQMNDLYSQANQLKDLRDSGQISDTDFQNAVDQISQSAILLYHQTAGLGNKAANNIRNNFSQFVTGGFVTPDGADSYRTNFGSKINSNQIVANSQQRTA